MSEKKQTNCESCEFYDWDEEFECYTCSQRLDQDERLNFMMRRTQACPYYRYHDEYQTVRKQI